MSQISETPLLFEQDISRLDAGPHSDMVFAAYKRGNPITETAPEFVSPAGSLFVGKEALYRLVVLLPVGCVLLELLTALVGYRIELT